MNKKQLLGLISVAGSLTALTLSAPAANALTWTVSATGPAATAIAGTFDIDNEAPPNDLTSITSSNITAGAVNYMTPNTFAVDGGGLFNSIQWVEANGNNGCANLPGCTLSLNFNPSLGTGGGTVPLGVTSFINQQGPLIGTVSGSVSASASGGTTNVIPFNFSTTPGLVVLGLITGVAKGRKHLPKIKEKLKELLTKK